MNSPSNSWSSPFETYQKPPPLPRNYSEVFDPADYECKSNIELESYARNLHNTLINLLPQKPFPAALFDKLEKRFDGLTSMLTKRCAASGVCTDPTTARLRLSKIAERLDKAVPAMPSLSTPSLMIDEEDHHTKRTRVDPDSVLEVRKAMVANKRKQDNFSFNEEAEEGQKTS